MLTRRLKSRTMVLVPYLTSQMISADLSRRSRMMNTIIMVIMMLMRIKRKLKLLLMLVLSPVT